MASALTRPLLWKRTRFLLARVSQARMSDTLTADGKKARKVRIYTRTGDAGKSSLYNGRRESKDTTYFSALGDVDELNSVVGVANEFCLDLMNKLRGSSSPNAKQLEELSLLTDRLKEIQSRLMDVGTAIATPITQSSKEQLERAAFDGGALDRLECWIDEMENELPPLRNFILPSGGLASSHLHVARSVCRRSERHCVTLHREGDLSQDVVRYLNRLSDFFFVAARFVAKQSSAQETLYKKSEGASVIAGGTAYIVSHIINPKDDETTRSPHREFYYDERAAGRPMHKWLGANFQAKKSNIVEEELDIRRAPVDERETV